MIDFLVNIGTEIMKIFFNINFLNFFIKYWDRKYKIILKIIVQKILNPDQDFLQFLHNLQKIVVGI